ncbi:MAG: DsbE family thiol:disulfide interchange protein [Frankiaceae bacterium]|nr:DsbE family thiol:disulfide interchange protein [Arenimonas sp.]
MIRRLLPLFAFLALAALLLVGVRMNSGKDTSAIASPLIGKPAPSFLLPVLGEPGRMVSDKDLLGQPYLLNVWGSWCVNCREEHPQITALAKSGRIRVVGYDYKDSPGDAQRWLQELGNPYSVIVADEEGRAALDWGIYGAPESFLVNAQGVIVWKTVGPISERVLREDVEAQLLAMGIKP